MDINDDCGEVPDRNEEHIIGPWQKEDLLIECKELGWIAVCCIVEGNIYEWRTWIFSQGDG